MILYKLKIIKNNIHNKQQTLTYNKKIGVLDFFNIEINNFKVVIKYNLTILINTSL